MTTVAFTINGKPASVEADADTPLLGGVDELAEVLGLQRQERLHVSIGDPNLQTRFLPLPPSRLLSTFS